MNKAVLTGVCGLAAVWLAGCQQAEESHPQAAVMTQPNQELTMANNGKQVRLKQGEKIELTLPGEPQSGYRWELVKLPQSLLQKKASQFKPADDDEVCGMQSLWFEAKGAGKGVLQLVYRSAQTNQGEDDANYYTLYLQVASR